VPDDELELPGVVLVSDDDVSLPVLEDDVAPGAPSVSELVPEPAVPDEFIEPALEEPEEPEVPLPDASPEPAASAVRVRFPCIAYHASNSACSTVPSSSLSADAKLGSRPWCADASAAVILPSPSVSSVVNERVELSAASAAKANTLATAPARDAAAYFIVGLLSERMKRATKLPVRGAHANVRGRRQSSPVLRGGGACDYTCLSTPQTMRSVIAFSTARVRSRVPSLARISDT
jgi:hypothetical protein